MLTEFFKKSQFYSVTRLFPLPKPSSSADTQFNELLRRVAALEAELPSMKTRMMNFDRDLQDVSEGFYRRRQADRMREIRQEDTVQKPKMPSWSEIQKRVLLEASKYNGKEGQTEE